MPPTLLLIRHAQALHNATSDWSIHDPPLSKLGEEQSKELQESLKNSQIANQVELIVVSPMRRTLQTASIGLEWLIKDKGIKVLTDAGWQGMFRCIHTLGSSNRTFFFYLPPYHTDIVRKFRQALRHGLAHLYHGHCVPRLGLFNGGPAVS